MGGGAVLFYNSMDFFFPVWIPAMVVYHIINPQLLIPFFVYLKMYEGKKSLLMQLLCNQGVTSTILS